MFEFAWPWIFAALPAPWLVRRRLPASDIHGAALRLPHAGVFAAGTAAPIAQRRGRTLLAALAWLLLVLAAARPQWIGEAVDLPQSGRDLLLAIDSSGSMNTPDMRLGGGEATRFQAVQVIAGDFIERRRGDRLGLILFGTQAYLLTPLTFDLRTVRTKPRSAMRSHWPSSACASVRRIAAY